MLYGLLGLISFVLGVWAVANIVNASEPTNIRVIWILVVLFFPFIGFIAWYFIGPKSALK